MSMSDINAQLRFAPGAGRLVRRHSAMLYVAQGAAATEMAQCFIDQQIDVGGAVSAVREFVIDRDFDAPGFVLVEWPTGEVVVTVFGPIDVETSSRYAPTLSGRSSTGLVEHRPDIDEPLTIAVAPGGVDATTSLGAGSIFADGFDLRLELDVSPTPVIDAPAPSADRAVSSPPLASEPRSEQPSAPLSWSPADLLADEPEHDLQPVPTDELPAAALSAAGTPDGSPTTTSSQPSVEARLCTCGRVNPPTCALCQQCGVSIEHIDLTVETRPTVAILELENGDVIDIDTNLSIGRQPPSTNGFDVVEVDLEGLSRHHIDVIIEGWDILVIDRESKNGVMVAAPGQGPDVIEPNQPWLVGIGSTLYLGTNPVKVTPPSEFPQVN